MAIGLIGGAIAFQVPVRAWQQMAPWLFGAGVVLLLLVLIPQLGREVNGARRWLPLGPVNLQPSELMKLFAVLYAADYTVRKLADMGSFRRGFLPMAAVILSVGFLLLREPDFGAFVVVAAIAFGILFLGGMNARLFFMLAVVAVAGFMALIWLSPYRRERLMGFMDPWHDAFGTGYQLSHALIAFGRGEWLGVGLGASVEKLFYLPEAHTDFLLAVIGEELGFAGVLCVVVLFALVVHRAFAIGRQALDAGARVCRPAGPGRRRVDRRAVAHQHGREHGPAAHQGSDAAADELRRLRHRRQLSGAGHPVARGLGKSAVDAGAEGMSPKLMVMAGGTGGHVFPGLAVADYMREHGWRVVWMGNPDGMEAKLVPSRGYDMAWVRFAALRGKGLLRMALLPVNLLRGFWQAFRELGRTRPDVVLGMGGYISFPGGMMSALRGVPLVVHEQNSVAGLANKVLASVADRVLTGFPKVLAKAQWVGNPVRRDIAELAPPGERYRGTQRRTSGAGGRRQSGGESAER